MVLMFAGTVREGRTRRHILRIYPVLEKNTRKIPCQGKIPEGKDLQKKEPSATSGTLERICHSLAKSEEGGGGPNQMAKTRKRQKEKKNTASGKNTKKEKNTDIFLK